MNIEDIAREGLALRERASPGSWTMRDDENFEAADGRLIHADGRDHTGNAELIAHAGTHYEPLCRAVLDAKENNRERDRILRELIKFVRGLSALKGNRIDGLTAETMGKIADEADKRAFPA